MSIQTAPVQTRASAMNDSDLFQKTAAGTDELKSRARGLPMRLRTMLIMVDGSRTVADLRAAAEALAVPADFLERLLQAGLIELSKRQVAAKPAAPAESPAAPTTGPAPLTSSYTLPAIPTDPERFVVAQKFMIETAVDSMGIRSYFFTLKLERCYTLDDLRALMPEFSQGLVKAKGELKARSLSQRLQALIG
jgi:hypothetical protein